MQGPWRLFFPHSRCNKSKCSQKSRLSIKRFLLCQSWHLQRLRSPTEQSREGKSARAVFYFLSLQNTSKKVSVTGKKKTFFFWKQVPKSDQKCFLSSVLFTPIVFTAEQKLIWKFLNALPAVYTKSSCTMVCKVVHSPAQSCHQHPSGITASKVHEPWRVLLQGPLVWGFPPLPPPAEPPFPHLLL